MARKPRRAVTIRVVELVEYLVRKFRLPRDALDVVLGQNLNRVTQASSRFRDRDGLRQVRCIGSTETIGRQCVWPPNLVRGPL